MIATEYRCVVRATCEGCKRTAVYTSNDMKPESALVKMKQSGWRCLGTKSRDYCAACAKLREE